MGPMSLYRAEAAEAEVRRLNDIIDWLIARFVRNYFPDVTREELLAWKGRR